MQNKAQNNNNKNIHCKVVNKTNIIGVSFNRNDYFSFSVLKFHIQFNVFKKL